MNSVWIVNNIPTPYRVYFFKALNEELEKRHISFHVSFMARTEKGRGWHYHRGEELGFPYTVHGGIHSNFGGIPAHINPGIMARCAFKKDDVSIVAGGWLHPTSFMLPVIRRKGLRLFWSESNLNSIRRTGAITSFMRRLLLAGFDGFCIPNDRAYEWLHAYVTGLEKKIVLTLPNLVNERFFIRGVQDRRTSRSELRARYRIDSKERVFICPARLLERKGIRAFLWAIKETSPSNVTLLIAGDGPDRVRLESIAASIQSMKIQFLGFCQIEEMIDLYALSDVFLLPSFEDPNPLSVIEACHSRLPLLISRRLGNLPETLKEGVNGWSFDPGEEESIRTAVDLCLRSSPEELIKMGENSYRIAQESFTTAKVVPRLVDSLDAAARENPKR